MGVVDYTVNAFNVDNNDTIYIYIGDATGVAYTLDWNNLFQCYNYTFGIDLDETGWNLIPNCNFNGAGTPSGTRFENSAIVQGFSSGSTGVGGLPQSYTYQKIWWDRIAVSPKIKYEKHLGGTLTVVVQGVYTATLVYDGRGASYTPAAQTLQQIAASGAYSTINTTVTTSIPVREGYTFTGWTPYSNITEYPTVHPGDSYDVNATFYSGGLTTTLYACWEKSVASDNVYVKYGGSWKKPQKMYAKYGGTWREVQKVYCKKNGTWRQV